uniref:Uncharacterized protein LOC100184438 n=1 Tax=Phallusia mammillata TaxID=59560 RepID=A0A6F9DHD2_9ASCI|nr:uncharacterized protein LOC100184438 [Phallusia mammillata]
MATANESSVALTRKESGVAGQSHKKKHSHHAIFVQPLPPSPKDCCMFCDPICADDYKLAVLSTVCCWLPLGILPVVFGIVGIHYAKKARKTSNPGLRKRYGSYSRTISWIGMLIFTVVITLAVIVLATCGIL